MSIENSKVFNMVKATSCLISLIGIFAKNSKQSFFISRFIFLNRQNNIQQYHYIFVCNFRKKVNTHLKRKITILNI